jgi:hypothetical protein
MRAPRPAAATAIQGNLALKHEAEPAILRDEPDEEDWSEF